MSIFKAKEQVSKARTRWIENSLVLGFFLALLWYGWLLGMNAWFLYIGKKYAAAHNGAELPKWHIFDLIGTGYVLYVLSKRLNEIFVKPSIAAWDKAKEDLKRAEDAHREWEERHSYISQS